MDSSLGVTSSALPSLSSPFSFPPPPSPTVAAVCLISSSSPAWLYSPISHHWVWLPPFSLVADMGMNHYQPWLTIHIVGSLGPTRGQWDDFPTAENMNFEQHFLTCRGPSWSGLIRGSMREWRREEAGKEEEKLPNSSALLISEMKYNLFRNMQIQQSLCLVYRRDLLIQSLKERERNNPNHRRQHTVCAQRQPAASHFTGFL